MADLKIYHNGSHSIVQETGSGGLLVLGSFIEIGSSSGSEKYFRGVANGAAELYHNNSKKIETTSIGIDVTGTTTDDGARHDGDVYFIGGTSGRNAVWDMSDNALEFADNAKVTFGASGDLEILHDGINSLL